MNIRRDALEASVLSGLRTHLMEPELCKEFCQEFTREVNRLRIERGADIEAQRRELERTVRELMQRSAGTQPISRFQLSHRSAEALMN
ncbi:hypothetical protein ACVWYQ_006065 [Bradyrhizobium sp. USDA 3397]